MGLQVSTRCCEINSADSTPYDDDYSEKEMSWDQASTALKSDYTRASNSSIWSIEDENEAAQCSEDNEPNGLESLLSSGEANGLESPSGSSARKSPSAAQRGEVPETVKLFIFVHGMCGSADDWSPWIDQIKKRQRPDWIVVAAKKITRHCGLLASGLETLADLLSDEVAEVLRDLLTASDDNVRADYSGCQCRLLAARGSKVVLNFVCHSLGGLTTRAALPDISRKIKALGERVELGHFLSLNSPHLGICSAGTATAWKNIARLCKLHRQLNLLDMHASGKCFLAHLADPEEEFMKELLKFQHCTTVAATSWDLLVPFCTAAICPSNPFPVTGPSQAPFWQVDAAIDESFVSSAGKAQQWHQELSKKEFLEAGCDWHCPSDGGVRFPESMYRGLITVPWRRVAFTVHRTIGAQVHTFCISKGQLSRRAKRWSLEFIDMLLDMLQ